MRLVNTKTGKDVTGYAIAYLEGNISRQEFENLSGLSAQKVLDKIEIKGINDKESDS